MKGDMDIKKVVIGIAVGCMFIFCFIRDIKIEDVAKEVVKAQVQEKINEGKAKIDSVKTEATKEIKKKFNILKPFFPNK
tara:strand:+ start:21 stop:257 length:237 start_codon:yes stop_codon:yes gene_type:complete